MNARGILTLLVISALLWMSVDYLGLETEGLFTRDALASFGTYVLQFFPPDTSGPFLVKLWSGTLETLAISALATLLAAVAGMLLAVPAAGRFGLAPRLVARFVLNALRSVPELVFAALMVIAAGLGPFPGTLALALHTTGVLGRLFAEALENTPREPADALLHAGSPRVAAFFYGTLPNVLPQCVAYALYRWEINIRMAAVLGFVGAGGLGQMLHVSLSLFQQQQACAVILAMLAIVMLVDEASAVLRRRVA
ncbi:MAG TPA: phosphonate ABC transporter, permease protein PhnE [Burkholderiales bacterium]|nr:phosphonate ABC transporter, permease protein PhnE [Burkholderiales bacterium]